MANVGYGMFLHCSELHRKVLLHLGRDHYAFVCWEGCYPDAVAGCPCIPPNGAFSNRGYAHSVLGMPRLRPRS